MYVLEQQWLTSNFLSANENLEYRGTNKYSR